MVFVGFPMVLQCVLMVVLCVGLYGGQFTRTSQWMQLALDAITWQELEDHFVDTRQLEMMRQTKQKEEK